MSYLNASYRLLHEEKRRPGVDRRLSNKFAGY